MARRKPTKPEAYMPGPPSKAKRTRGWEREQRNLPGLTTVTFRRIPEELRDEINRIAREMYVNRDEVARALLEAGMSAFQAGQVELNPTFVRGKLRLYPDDQE